MFYSMMHRRQITDCPFQWALSKSKSRIHKGCLTHTGIYIKNSADEVTTVPARIWCACFKETETGAVAAFV
jgi:hypothetical protein